MHGMDRGWRLGSTLRPRPAQEQEQSAEQLRGTLGKIDRSGVVTIGYREASFPLSYVDPKGQPIGYSIDLCKAIVGEVAREIDNPRIKIEFAPVTPRPAFRL